MSSKFIEKILFLPILAMLFFPAIQKETGIFPIPALHGDFKLAEKPSPNAKNWMSGEFQSKFNRYIEDHIGFRNLLVRLTDQIDFSLFNETRAEGVVIGKKDMLFEYDYIRAVAGGDFLGEKVIDKRIRRTKFLQEYLKREKNIDFFVVFEPGKASFYPEYIPDRYQVNRNPETNYEWYTKKAEEYNLNFIDFNKWFKDLKPVAPYPLYAQYGTHWSIYGMSFTVDSLIRYMEKIHDIDMREVSIDTLVLTRKPHKEDYDIAYTMNLLFRMPEHETLAYPEFKFGPRAGKDYPMVLVIADSYFWNIFNTNVPYAVFKNQAFWYFGHWIYPETYRDTLEVPQLNLKKEVEKQDIISLMVTERFLHKYDWGFVDNLYKIYGITSKYDKIYDYMAEILIYTEWFNAVVEKAAKRKIQLSEMLELEARYVYQMKDPQGYMTFMGQEHYEWAIRHDPHWLSLLQKQAEEDHIPVDELIHREAANHFKADYPEAYDTYMKIQQNKNLIRKDKLHMNKVRKEADYYYLTIDEMLQIEAERMLDQDSPLSPTE